jgi:hypothetical protein
MTFGKREFCPLRKNRSDNILWRRTVPVQEILAAAQEEGYVFENFTPPAESLPKRQPSAADSPNLANGAAWAPAPP